MDSFESTAFVWRYMSLEKFEWMLTNKALYLARMDQFDDPWELAPAFHQLGATQFTGLNSGGVPTYNASAESMRLLLDQSKRWHFVSCWSAMATESHALWQINCGKTEGVAGTRDVRASRTPQGRHIATAGGLP